MNLETTIAVPTIVLGAYFIRGITGFGSGLLSIPLLALLLPLQTVVPLVLVLDFSASLIMSRNAHEHVRWKEIIPLLPTSLLGIIIGITLLLTLPREPLLISLALFVILFGLRYLLNIHGDRIVSKLWSLPAGLVGGLVGAVFGTGGPPYVIYLTHRIKDKSQLRATFSGLFMIDGSIRMISFIVTGLLGVYLLPLLILSAPVMILGLYLGGRAHIGVSNRQMLILIGSLLLVSGGSLLFKAWS